MFSEYRACVIYDLVFGLVYGWHLFLHLVIIFGLYCAIIIIDAAKDEVPGKIICGTA